MILFFKGLVFESKPNDKVSILFLSYYDISSLLISCFFLQTFHLLNLILLLLLSFTLNILDGLVSGFFSPLSSIFSISW